MKTKYVERVWTSILNIKLKGKNMNTANYIHTTIYSLKYQKYQTQRIDKNGTKQAVS